MKIKINYDEHELKELIISDLKSKLNDIPFDKNNIIIEVKSKQNYKAEWEKADFRASYSYDSILKKFLHG